MTALCQSDRWSEHRPVLIHPRMPQPIFVMCAWFGENGNVIADWSLAGVEYGDPGNIRQVHLSCYKW